MISVEVRNKKFLYQWDQNQSLEIRGVDPDNTEVHLALHGDSEALVVDTEVIDDVIIAPIPDVLLQDGRNIEVYVYSAGETLYKAEIYVKDRPQPVGYTDAEDVLRSLVDRSIVEVAIPEDTTTIGVSAFYLCENLEHVAIPNTVNLIRTEAFRGCLKLDGVVLPAELNTLASHVFEGCKALSRIMIPEKVSILYGSVFANCISLTEVVFAGTPRSVHATVFDGCPNLTTIKVPWAEGEVAGAPWGATNATVVYNSEV